MQTDCQAGKFDRGPSLTAWAQRETPGRTNQGRFSGDNTVETHHQVYQNEHGYCRPSGEVQPSLSRWRSSDAVGEQPHHVDVAQMSAPAPRPTALPVIAANIPSLLQARDQFLVWGYTLFDEKWTKPPTDARDGSAGSSTRRSTWSPFEVVVNVYRSGRWDGIGYALANDDPFYAMDLDNCFLESGEINPFAQAIVDRTRGYLYWERSPSGKGLRGFGIGTLPPGRRKKQEFEIYSEGRFVSVTGQVFDGCDQIGGDSTELVVEIHREQFGRSEFARPTQPSTTPPGEDLEIVDRCRRFKSGPKFERLMMGSTADYGGDDSAADAALIGYLLFANGGDAEQAVRIASNSGLWREKWDSRRGDTDYIRYTALRILGKMSSFFTPGGPVQEIDGEPVKMVRVRVGG